jgi:hypothetical protein
MRGDKKGVVMPWYKIVIVNNDSAPWSAIGLMKKFILKYKLLGSPQDAVVYRGVNDSGDHVYYFSPEASAIAISEKVFYTFDVRECLEEPSLDGFKEIMIR